MLVANGRVVIANTAAERLVKPEDDSRCVFTPKGSWRAPRPAVVDIVLANGRGVAVRCEPILDGSVAVGVVMHLEDGPGRAIGRCWGSPASLTPSAPSPTSSPKV